MSVETLIQSQMVAASKMGIPYGEVEEMQEPQLHPLGTITVQETGVELAAYRSHSGPDASPVDDQTVLKAKGGIRIEDYAPDVAEATVEELSVEMLWKLWLRNYAGGWRGGKGLIVGDPRSLSFDQRRQVMRDYERLMEDAGLAGYTSDVPAGDGGTNGLCDEYALSRRDNGDPFWQVSITGKSVANGGLGFRTSATGWGGYVTQRTLLSAEGRDTPITTTFQGFGNVAAWHAHYAGSDPLIRVGAISDRDGMIYTDHPEGLVVSEGAVREIGDNPSFKGDKIAALAERIEREQGITVRHHSRSADILTYPTDDFVPASVLKDTINEETVESLAATHAIIEDSNGPTTAKAHRRLVEKGIIVMPDIVTNGAGVDCSIKEYDFNVATARGLDVVPNDLLVQEALTNTSEELVRRVLKMAEELNNPDLRVAAAAVSLGPLLGRRAVLV